jgi:RNA polymerase sigma-70 factor (ECF subfamily)
VFERLAPVVFRYACARVGPDLAEDIVAQTFTEAWRTRERFDPAIGTSEAWLLGIATTMIARSRRAEARWLRSAPFGDVSGDDAIADAEDRAEARRLAIAIRSELAKLPAREREVLLLHVVGGLSYQAIADVQGIPIGTVRSRISRGRDRILRGVSR